MPGPQQAAPSDTAKQVLAAAQRARVENRLADADAGFARLARLQPDQPWNWYMAAEIRRRLGDRGGAAARFRRAVVLRPDLPGAAIRTLTLDDGLAVAARTAWVRRLLVQAGDEPVDLAAIAWAATLQIAPAAGLPVARRAALACPESLDALRAVHVIGARMRPDLQPTPEPFRLLALAPDNREVLGHAVVEHLRRGDGRRARALSRRTAPSPERVLAARLLTPGETVLDIGALIGTTAIEFLAAGAGHVHCVEPNPGNAALLRRNLGPDATVHEVALGAADGPAEFSMPAGRPGAGTLEGSDGHWDGESVTRLTVSVRRLDGLRLPRCGFWKIDVERHELATLDGAAETLRSRAPDWVLIEIFEHPPTLTGRVDQVTRRLRRYLPFRYQVDGSSERGVRVRPLPPGDRPVPHRRLNTATPLYLFGRRPVPGDLLSGW